jgi:hypothetical protein
VAYNYNAGTDAGSKVVAQWDGGSNYQTRNVYNIVGFGYHKCPGTRGRVYWTALYGCRTGDCPT